MIRKAVAAIMIVAAVATGALAAAQPGSRGGSPWTSTAQPGSRGGSPWVAGAAPESASWPPVT